MSFGTQPASYMRNTYTPTGSPSSLRDVMTQYYSQPDPSAMAQNPFVPFDFRYGMGALNQMFTPQRQVPQFGQQQPQMATAVPVSTSGPIGTGQSMAQNPFQSMAQNPFMPTNLRQGLGMFNSWGPFKGRIF